MNATKDMAAAVTNWAREDDNVRGAVLTSNRADPNGAPDALTDYDIELFVRDFTPFLEQDDWLDNFGEVMIRQPVHPALDGNILWRLVMFRDAPRIDFAIQLEEEIDNELAAPELHESYDIGYEVLLDKDGKICGWPKPTYTGFQTKPPTPSEYEELVHHFWWNITYVAKALHRGRIFRAKQMLDASLLHSLLATLLGWHIGMRNDWTTNPGAGNRYLHQLLDPGTLRQVKSLFVGSDPNENWDAMFRTAELFGRLSKEVGEHMGFGYPLCVEQDITKHLWEVKALGDD